MNKFIIMGRLTADPEIKNTQSGKQVTRFNIAVNRRFRRDDDPDADFFRCVAFGKTADTIQKCAVCKGTKLLIDGEMRNNNYTDAEGVKHYDMQVVVNHFEFCESKKTANAAQTAPADNNGFSEFTDDDELPF